MTEAGEDICSPCEYNNKINKATNCCVDCKELLCAECFGHHNSHRQSRNHHIITADENKILEALKIPLTEYCDVHNQIKDLYCSSHDEVVCLTCSQTNHVKCEPSARLRDAAQNAKSSTCMSILEEEINALMETLKNNTDDRVKQKKIVTDQRDDILQTIRNIRSFVNKKLDQLEDKIVKELNDNFEKVVSKINDTTEFLQSQQQELIETSDKLNILQSFASDTQIFIAMRTLRNMVKETDEKITSCVDDINDNSLQMVQDQDIFTIFSSAKSFGDIKVETKMDTQHKLSKNKSFQSPSSRRSNVIQFRKKQTIKLPQDTLFKSIILSCGFISNRQVIFVDSHARNKKLIIHEQNGEHVRSVELPSKPFDITTLGNDKIALSFPWSTRKRVDIMNTVDYDTEHSIHFKNQCYGISFEDGKLYVVVKTEGILVMDLAGQLWTSLPICGNGIYYVHVKSGLLYCSDEVNDTVKCYDKDGNSIWTYKNPNLRSPRAITSSDDGYIFIAGCKSNCVVALDIAGNFKEDISGIWCGFNSPTGVCFDPERKLLLACNSSNSRAVLCDIV